MCLLSPHISSKTNLGTVSWCSKSNSLTSESQTSAPDKNCLGHPDWKPDYLLLFAAGKNEK